MRTCRWLLLLLLLALSALIVEARGASAQIASG
jgi:hypothetical protein